MKTAVEARAEAMRRGWPWIVYDPNKKRWGYARTNPVPGGENCLYFPSSMSMNALKIAAFDSLEGEYI